MTSAVMLALFFIVPALVAALAVTVRNQGKELSRLSKRVERLSARPAVSDDFDTDEMMQLATKLLKNEKE